MIDYMKEAELLFPYTQAMRRDFHKHPEIGYEETRTAGIVTKELTELSIDVRTNVAKTGVIGLLSGKKEGPVILVRADMDALPIQEETNVEYASINDGVMHACGHDGHTAVLLSVAKLLKSHEEELSGKVKFVFQPAEEGLGGAERMIQEGVLENPKPDITLALHVWNDKPLGWFGISQGPAMAGAEIFKIKIKGKGGHGAAPHLAIDPLLAASQIIIALQSITARNVPPLKSAVVSVCTIQGGNAFNVIPQNVQMAGTIRTFDPEVREKVLERFEVIVYGMAETMGCSAEIELDRLTPAVINDIDASVRIKNITESLFPNAIIDSSKYITMGSEDMAFIMEEVPGCYFFIGSANSENQLDASLHHPLFDFDEQALVNATALMSASVMNLLNQP